MFQRSLIPDILRKLPFRNNFSTSVARSPTHFVFIGAPGVGKGTFANIICKREGWVHLSLGDLLREEVKNGTQVGKKVASLMSGGHLVPDEVANAVLSSHLAQHASSGFILDGYPRTVSQAHYLDETFARCSGGSSLVAVNITLARGVALQKLLARQTCTTCGGSFNTAHIVADGYDMPAILPNIEKCVKGAACNPVMMSRDDDTEEALRRRFEEFAAKTAPLLAFYELRGALRSFDVKKGVKDTGELLALMKQPVCAQ